MNADIRESEKAFKYGFAVPETLKRLIDLSASQRLAAHRTAKPRLQFQSTLRWFDRLIAA